MSDLDKIDQEVPELPVPDELETLKAKAKLIGMSFHPLIKADALRAKIAAHIAGDDTDVPEPTVELAPETETAGQKRARMRRDALALVRVNITCMNPNKRDWDGEILAVGNSNLATIKKFIPFNTVDGYHIPKIMLDMMRARECQVFYTERTKNGINVRKGKMIKEFGIEVLEPLTASELADLAKVQAAAGIIA